MPLPMKRYLITLDPGQKQDPAAIQVYKAVPELVHPDPLIAEAGKIIYRDDLVMQYKLSDKRYTALADFVVGLMSRKSLSSESVLVFDATGVGAAVKDLFHAQGVKDMIPIVYTAGGKVSFVYRDQNDRRFRQGQNGMQMQVLDEIHVPKSDLVDAAKAELERKAIRPVPGIPYLEEFQTQLLEFKGKMNQKGYVSYNNSKDEIHDDLVNCFMMRCFIRRFFRAEIYREEKTYETTRGESVSLRQILGERASGWR